MVEATETPRRSPPLTGNARMTPDLALKILTGCREGLIKLTAEELTAFRRFLNVPFEHPACPQTKRRPAGDHWGEYRGIPIHKEVHHGRGR